MKKIILILILIFSPVFILTPSSSALAAYECICEGLTTSVQQNSCSDCNTYCQELDPKRAVKSCTVISTSKSKGNQVSLTDPIGLNGDYTSLYSRIIVAILGFIGIGALIAFVYAGFVFLISAGNPERVKKAKDTMLYAVIGVFISMASYAILSFIFRVLEGATGQ